MPAPRRILGIDPGLNATGYAILEVAGTSYRAVETGTIKPPKGGDIGERLRHINDALFDVIARMGPEEAAVENIFHHKNAKSALLLGQARGAAILAAAAAGLPVFEYSALQVKQAVAGYGRAAKEQIQKVLPAIVKIAAPFDSADAADALAVAFCHSGHMKSPARQRCGPPGLEVVK